MADGRRVTFREPRPAEEFAREHRGEPGRDLGGMEVKVDGEASMEEALAPAPAAQPGDGEDIEGVAVPVWFEDG